MRGPFSIQFVRGEVSFARALDHLVRVTESAVNWGLFVVIYLSFRAIVVDGSYYKVESIELCAQLHLI